MYLKRGNRTVARFMPEDKPECVEIPSPPSVASLVAAYKPRAQVGAGEAFAATPEALEACTVRNVSDPAFKYTELRKQNRGNAVKVSINLRWGELSEQIKRQALSKVGSLLWEGESTRAKQARQDALTKLTSRVSLRGGGQGASISIARETRN